MEEMKEKELLIKEIEELKKQKELIEREMIINFADNENYYFNEIMESNEVKKQKNILAVDYHLKHFIPLINLVGFKKVNKMFFEIWEEKQKKQEEGEEQC